MRASEDGAPMTRAAQQILDVARSVLAELDVDVVLERVLDAAQELTEARYAALGVLDESRSELARFITRGIDPSRRTRAIGSRPRGRGRARRPDRAIPSRCG